MLGVFRSETSNSRGSSTERGYLARRSESTRSKYTRAFELIKLYIEVQCPDIRRWSDLDQATYRDFLGYFCVRKVAIGPTAAKELLSALRVFLRWHDERYGTQLGDMYESVYQRYRRRLPDAVEAQGLLSDWFEFRRSTSVVDSGAGEAILQELGTLETLLTSLFTRHADLPKFPLWQGLRALADEDPSLQRPTEVETLAAILERIRESNTPTAEPLDADPDDMLDGYWRVEEVGTDWLRVSPYEVHGVPEDDRPITVSFPEHVSPLIHVGFILNLALVPEESRWRIVDHGLVYPD